MKMNKLASLSAAIPSSQNLENYQIVPAEQHGTLGRALSQQEHPKVGDMLRQRSNFKSNSALVSLRLMDAAAALERHCLRAACVKVPRTLCRSECSAQWLDRQVCIGSMPMGTVSMMLVERRRARGEDIVNVYCALLFNFGCRNAVQEPLSPLGLVSDTPSAHFCIALADGLWEQSRRCSEPRSVSARIDICGIIAKTATCYLPKPNSKLRCDRLSTVFDSDSPGGRALSGARLLVGRASLGRDPAARPKSARARRQLAPGHGAWAAPRLASRPKCAMRSGPSHVAALFSAVHARAWSMQVRHQAAASWRPPGARLQLEVAACAAAGEQRLRSRLAAPSSRPAEMRSISLAPH